MLEHIVERKRIDDLAGSITDGRFGEQKVHTDLDYRHFLLYTYVASSCTFICSFVYTTVVCDIRST